jgi:hypothetical protein
VHIGSRLTVIAMPPLFVVGVAAVVVASCSSPDPKASATASAAESTSSQSETLTPDPNASPPVTPSGGAPSATSPASAGPSQVPKPRRVNVTTTFAGWNATTATVEVGGYAAVVEPVGTCTLRLTHGTQVVTLKHAATADATTVACGGFSVPRKQLTAGQWQAVLAYASSKSAGAAAAVMVKVP